MHPELKSHFNLSQPEYRSFIATRARLAIIDLERLADVPMIRLNGEAAGLRSIDIAQQFANQVQFVIKELDITVLLTDKSFLSFKERIEYGKVFGFGEHKLPHREFGFWYISGLNLRPRLLLTAERINQLRERGDGAIKSLDEQTPIQIAEKFSTAIYNELKLL